MYFTEISTTTGQSPTNKELKTTANIIGWSPTNGTPAMFKKRFVTWTGVDSVQITKEDMIRCYLAIRK